MSDPPGSVPQLSPNREVVRAAEELKPGLRVEGLIPGEVDHGRRRAVARRGRTGADLQDGRRGARSAGRVPQGRGRRSAIAQSGSRAFDASASDFKLVAEAQRISLAGLFDPMLAVATSDVQPLPHQIRAVYGELLPRTPLRFLLADDPGAGKTIMAGLYIKELLLRDDVKQCLIVAPGGLVEQWQDELFFKFGLRFDLLTNQLIDAQVNVNVFETNPLLIARMDQLSRNEQLAGPAQGDRVGPDHRRRGAPHGRALLRRKAAQDQAVPAR